MKLIDLLEARRKSPQNPKFSQLEQLKQIAQKYGTKNVYCRFVGVPMLKNTILTKYDTPLGMCCYPLQYVIDKEMDVPFAGACHYILVFKPVSVSNIWKLDDSMVSTMIPRILKGIASVTKHKLLPIKEMQTDRELWYYMYNCIDIINQNKKALLARQILLSAGIIGVDDPGHGIIHQNEPTQAVFFNASDLQLLSVINNLNIDAIIRSYLTDFDYDTSFLAYMAYRNFDIPRISVLRIAAKASNKLLKMPNLLNSNKLFYMITQLNAETLAQHGFNIDEYYELLSNSTKKPIDPQTTINRLIKILYDNQENNNLKSYVKMIKQYLNIIDPNILKKENLA